MGAEAPVNALIVKTVELKKNKLKKAAYATATEVSQTASLLLRGNLFQISEHRLAFK